MDKQFPNHSILLVLLDITVLCKMTNNNILITISIHHQDVCLEKLNNGALLDEIFKAEKDVRVLY